MAYTVDESYLNFLEEGSYYQVDENYEWENPEYLDLNSFLQGNSEIQNIPLFINNADYTLNSPLIVDQLSSFIRYLTKNTKETLYYQKSWESNKSWLNSIRSDWISVLDPILLHNKLSKIWKDEDISVKDITKLIQEADNHSRSTFSVIETYLDKWIKKDIRFMSRCTNNRETLLIGAHMLDALKITWILNASTKYELDSLKKHLPLSFLNEKDHKMGISYQSAIFGQIYIGPGIIYIPKINMLWDRNMLLLYKDTATARFHTLFAIQHRQFFRYHPSHYQLQVELYKIGDEILAHDTVSGFEALGMIEPLSSLRLSELAGGFRPHIPPFTHFRHHIESKFEELMRTNPHTKKLFQLINSITDKHVLLTYYGSFRHWGHPFINYMEGLSSLYKNVTSTKNKIDSDYAALLASDLAYKVLKKEFQSKYKWCLDIKKMPDGHPLIEHVKNNTWPAIDVIIDLPPQWHLLPLTKTWDVPEVVDPTLIYSDKTHSIQKSELVRHLLSSPNKPIPTRKVLNTLLTSPSTNWPQFLKEINEIGLLQDDLIIGLKAKEREIKWKGRFFALMSWRLREYFVFTEYLIKKNVIPLFKGLTMADDQTTLIKKMLANTAGQGSLDYKNITIANHIDYEKWNNFQRQESTEPVFRVMGQFFGLPNLFARTHEFFSKSLVYYRDRPDLMCVKDGEVINRNPNQRVCWNGQAGGFEGLRQKGWSVLNLLCIERESRIRNTEVKILAQGDNQVICCLYKLNPSTNESDMISQIHQVVQNNNVIMSAIRSSTLRIGLLINEDETLQATDMLIYGKVIIYRGNITSLDEKRYSRITCTTNDQLPSLGNILATVATNCLTVSHFSKSPLNPIVNYNWLGNFVLSILELHNPALRCRPVDLVSDYKIYTSKDFRIAALYLDPSIGGISGMSLTRFHLRMFPDPVAESLSFWKIISKTTKDTSICNLALSMGNPQVMVYQRKHFAKLIEDPSSLNLPKGLSAQNLIKGEIKQTLYNDPSVIKHEIIREAVRYAKASEDKFLTFLESITPCFPRFISEFRSASYFGMTDGVMGLFENSKTIRNLFKAKFRSKVDEAILKCEVSSIESLIRKCKKKNSRIWNCSAKQADDLRLMSWKRKIVGMTVPHPVEMISIWSTEGPSCTHCNSPGNKRLHIICIVPDGIHAPDDVRGPYHPYLGSSTRENTSLIQSWEKDTDISFIKKASNLRRAFHWFIDPTSNLGKSINQNLESLTGENPGATISGFKRTGSALHRYGCSRISSGGYIANSTVYGTRMIISTDNFQQLGDKNYDFMYQPLMLFVQQTVGEIHNESPVSITYHFHVACGDCIRPIDEPILDSVKEFKFPDMSVSLSKWKPSNTKWLVEYKSGTIPKGQWRDLPHRNKSYEVGLTQGLMFGHLYRNHSDSSILSGLFPIGLRKKLNGDWYLDGLIDGLYRAAAVDATHRRIFYKIPEIGGIIRACYLSLISSIILNSNFIAFVQSDNILNNLKTVRHRIPPSYPLNSLDTGAMARSYLESRRYDDWLKRTFTKPPPLWIFADFLSSQLSGFLIIAYDLVITISKENLKNIRARGKELGDLLAALKSSELLLDVYSLLGENKEIYLCDQEVRHAIKNDPPSLPLSDQASTSEYTFGQSFVSPVRLATLEYTSMREEPPSVEVPRIQNPLVSGLRIPQLATGSFLKIESIIYHLKLTSLDILCGGDGSGGISACLLRTFPSSRLIFNSLLDLTNVELNGALPQAPSAISYLTGDVKNRCVNLHNNWELPQDLSKEETWRGFIILKKKHNLRLDLMVFDMEIKSEDIINKIDKLMIQYLPRLLEVECTVIIKTYIHRIYSESYLIQNLGRIFHIVMLSQTGISSSHTSEIYAICQRLRTVDVIKIYPSFSSTEKFMGECFCFRNYKLEFKRAQGIFLANTIRGIPLGLIPDPISELVNIWIDLSDDRITATRLEHYARNLSKHGFKLGLISSALIFNKILPTTKWFSQNQFPIPSDKTLSSLFAYYIGVGLYCSLCVQDYHQAEKYQEMINNPFYIFISIRNRTLVGLAEKQEFSQQLMWSLIKPTKIQKYKRVFVQDKLALVGSTLRYFTSYQNKTYKYDKSLIDLSTLTLFNKALTAQHIQQYTGILDLWR